MASSFLHVSVYSCTHSVAIELHEKSRRHWAVLETIDAESLMASHLLRCPQEDDDDDEGRCFNGD